MLASHELEAFAAAVEAGSVHDAADALDLTPSAVTKRLQSLERQLGVTLFERRRDGLRPTDAGRTLYPEARQALLALRRAESAVSTHRTAADALLVLAASHTTGEFLLPGWLAAFRAGHPDVRAQVDVVNSAGVVDAVRRSRADVGFVEGLDELGALESKVVFRDEIVVAVSAEHRWVGHVTQDELAGEPYFTREAGSGTRAVAAARLHVAPEPALEAASFQAVKRALGERGFSLLSRLAIETELRAGTLRALTVEDADLHRELRAIRRREPLPRAAAAFWNALRADR